MPTAVVRGVQLAMGLQLTNKGLRAVWFTDSQVRVTALASYLIICRMLANLLAIVYLPFKRLQRCMHVVEQCSTHSTVLSGQATFGHTALHMLFVEHRSEICRQQRTARC